LASLKSTTTRELTEARALVSRGITGETSLILGLAVTGFGAGAGRTAENNTTANPKQAIIKVVLNELFWLIITRE
jgi:hypothetical protein